MLYSSWIYTMLTTRVPSVELYVVNQRFKHLSLSIIATCTKVHTADKSLILRVKEIHFLLNLWILLEWIYSPLLPFQPKVIPNAICGICLKGKESNKKGKAEALIHCSQCDNSGKYPYALTGFLREYLWQIFGGNICTCVQQFRCLLSPSLKLPI